MINNYFFHLCGLYFAFLPYQLSTQTLPTFHSNPTNFPLKPYQLSTQTLPVFHFYPTYLPLLAHSVSVNSVAVADTDTRHKTLLTLEILNAESVRIRGTDALAENRFAYAAI